MYNVDSFIHQLCLATLSITLTLKLFVFGGERAWSLDNVLHSVCLACLIVVFSMITRIILKDFANEPANWFSPVLATLGESFFRDKLEKRGSFLRDDHAAEVKVEPLAPDGKKQRGSHQQRRMSRSIEAIAASKLKANARVANRNENASDFTQEPLHEHGREAEFSADKTSSDMSKESPKSLSSSEFDLKSKLAPQVKGKTENGAEKEKKPKKKKKNVTNAEAAQKNKNSNVEPVPPSSPSSPMSPLSPIIPLSPQMSPKSRGALLNPDKGILRSPERRPSRYPELEISKVGLRPFKPAPIVLTPPTPQYVKAVQESSKNLPSIAKSAVVTNTSDYFEQVPPPPNAIIKKNKNAESKRIEPAIPQNRAGDVPSSLPAFLTANAGSMENTSQAFCPAENPLLAPQAQPNAWLSSHGAGTELQLNCSYSQLAAMTQPEGMNADSALGKTSASANAWQNRKLLDLQDMGGIQPIHNDQIRSRNVSDPNWSLDHLSPRLGMYRGSQPSQQLREPFFSPTGMQKLPSYADIPLNDGFQLSHDTQWLPSMDRTTQGSTNLDIFSQQPSVRPSSPFEALADPMLESNVWSSQFDESSNSYSRNMQPFSDFPPSRRLISQSSFPPRTSLSGFSSTGFVEQNVGGYEQLRFPGFSLFSDELQQPESNPLQDGWSHEYQCQPHHNSPSYLFPHAGENGYFAASKEDLCGVPSQFNAGEVSYGGTTFYGNGGSSVREETIAESPFWMNQGLPEGKGFDET